MRSSRLATVVAGLVAAACCAGIPAARALPDPPVPTPSPHSPGADAPDPPAAPKTVIDEDGYYTVGTDIEPGTYQSQGPAEGHACYWKRMRGDEVVDNVLSKKPQVVRIEPTDTTFKTDQCQPWQRVDCGAGCAPPTQQQPPGLLDLLKGFLASPPQAPGNGPYH